MRTRSILLLAALVACGDTTAPAPGESQPTDAAPEATARADESGPLELRGAMKAYETGDRKSYVQNLDAYLERIDGEVATWQQILEEDEIDGVEADKIRELAATTARLQEELDAVGAERWRAQAEAINEQVAEIDEQVTLYTTTFEQSVDLEERSGDDVD